MWALFRALDRGWTSKTIHELTKIDPWFLQQFAEIVELRKTADWSACETCRTTCCARSSAPASATSSWRTSSASTRPRCARGGSERGIVPAYKRIDTCAAEFESFTPYMYGTLRAGLRGGSDRQEEGHHPRQRPEPHRPGHRVRLLLLSRGLRLPRRRLRDGDGQLQPGDGVDRLRHGRPACTSSR